MTDPWSELEGKAICLYGAQMVAGSMYMALTALYHVKTTCFLVTHRKGNPSDIDGIPVIPLAEKKKGVQELPVVAAAPVIHHRAIVQNLQSLNFQQIMCVDSAAENYLLTRYYRKLNKIILLSDLKEKAGEVGRLESIVIGKVHSAADTPLAAKVPVSPACMTIQAGAALSGVPEGRLGDHTGDNISAKNPYYSELTALYWLWKNRPSEYMGLCHYRRIFDVTAGDLNRLTKNPIDVLLPYPSIHFPDCGVHLKRYLDEEEIRLLFQALKHNGEGWADTCHKLLKEKYFYHFNMFLARREVAGHFCQWLFKILADVEQLSEKQGKSLHERSLGYMGECLTSLYFTRNAAQLSQVHCGVTMFL